MLAREIGPVTPVPHSRPLCLPFSMHCCLLVRPSLFVVVSVSSASERRSRVLSVFVLSRPTER